MVLTVTINPLLEKRFQFPEIQIGGVNRSNVEIFKAGGKGINVSRQLTKLGIKNQAITFAGGMNGKLFRRVIAAEDLDAVLVGTKNETRWASVIEEREKVRVTSYFSPNQEISESEANEFINKLKKMIPNASIVLLAGSAPNKTAWRIYEAAIEIAAREDKIVLLDTYGDNLEKLINKSPMVLHNNVEELEKSLGIKLETDDEIIEFLKNIYNKGIKLAFITNGSKEVYALKFGFIYKITPPVIENEIDSTGSGDAFTAGICAGLEKNSTFDEFVNYACKLGALNAASWNTCAVEPEELNSVADAVIESIGKKMKIIDDSPNYK